MIKNPKMAIILGVLALLLVIGLIWSHLDHSQPEPANAPLETQHSIKDKVSGDTENEVLKTVLANQEALKLQNKKVQQENEQLKEKGIEQASTEIKTQKQILEEEITKLKSEFDTKITEQQNNPSKSDYAINGATWSDASSAGGEARVIGSVPDLNQNNVSSDKLEKLEKPTPVVTSAKPVSSDEPPSLPSDAESSSDSNVANNITPFYTIPANSTLNHVKLMTAIIAEVPVSGRLVSPAFPFKAIIGRKELFAANGMSLSSDLSGTVVQGYSVGSMTLSCARLYVTRMLFVFNDGHFVVYPDRDDNEDATNLYPKNALGYLSDSYGNTCLVGKYITDAPKVLANLALLGGISTGANAVAASQFTTINNGQSFNTAMTGDMAKLVGASAVGGGSQEILQWYKERVGDVFDAVFIPASFNHKPTDLVFNISKTIPIDLNKKGRTLRYANPNALSDTFKRFD